MGFGVWVLGFGNYFNPESLLNRNMLGLFRGCSAVTSATCECPVLDTRPQPDEIRYLTRTTWRFMGVSNYIYLGL